MGLSPGMPFLRLPSLHVCGLRFLQRSPCIPASGTGFRHDMLSFLHSFFTMKAYLPEFRIEKLLWIPPMMPTLSMSTADGKRSRPLLTSIPDIPDISLIRTISPLIRTAFQSVRWAYVCTKMDMRLPNTVQNTGVQKQTENAAVSVSIPVHRRNTEGPYTSLPMTIQGLFNIPPRDSKAWEKEYDGRTSVERSNKREKEDYKLEDGRHRSTKMWYCRLYGIMMLQHLDAWEMPSVEAFQKSLLGLTA